MNPRDLYLRRDAIRQLSKQLRELAGWALDDLDDVVCRQTSYGVPYLPRHSGSRDDPLVFNQTASDVAHDVRGTLRAWVEHVCAHSTRRWPGEQRAAAYAWWLDRHLIDLAKTEEAPDAADELHDVWKRVTRAIDRPMPPEFVGPCQSPDAVKIAAGQEIENPVRCDGVYCPRGKIQFDCTTCSITIDVPSVRAATEETLADRLFTKQDLRDALTRFVKKPISRHRIDGWIRRGRLNDHAGKYKLAEALLLLHGDERQEERHTGS